MNQDKTKIPPFHKAVPVGPRITVVLQPADKLSDIIEVVNVNLDKEAKAREWGIVASIGPGAFGETSPIPDPFIKIGDLAIFKKYAGSELTDLNNKDIKYRTMNDDEVWNRIPKEILEEEGYDASYAREGIKQFQKNAVLSHVRKE